MYLIRRIRKNKLLFLTSIFLILGCESESPSKSELEPHEKIIGSWAVKKVITDYNWCGWGTGEYNHYNEYYPSDEGYWHYFVNNDGTFEQESSINNNLSEDTGVWELIDGILTLEYENKTENWSAGFSGNDILILSNLIDCSHGGTIYSSREWKKY
mgnify:CR=1 FL=1